MQICGLYICVYVRVCECVCKRYGVLEGGKERGRETGRQTDISNIILLTLCKQKSNSRYLDLFVVN